MFEVEGEGDHDHHQHQHQHGGICRCRGLIASLHATVDAIVAADPTGESLDDLAGAIEQLHILGNKVDAADMRLLGAYDAAGGLAQIAGHRTTTGDWLAKTTGITSARGRGVAGAAHTAGTARALRDDLTDTAGQLGRGAISLEHVRAIRGARRILGEDYANIEATVAGIAAQHTAADLRTILEVIIQQYRPEIHDDLAEHNRARRKVDLSPGLDNTWILNGLLDAATGRALAAAFDLYAAPTGPDDTRTPGQRRADALAEIATRSTDDTDRPTGLGHVTITVTPDQLSSRLGVRWPSGLLMSRAEVAEHTCTANLTLVVGLTADQVRWQPLAVGFAKRYATKAQRAALAVRDGNGCIHPGCTVPAHRCIAHHIRPWNQGGPTDLPNLVLVCRSHHRRSTGRLHIIQTPTGAYTTTDRPPTGHPDRTGWPGSPVDQDLGTMSERPLSTTRPAPFTRTEPVVHAAATTLREAGAVERGSHDQSPDRRRPTCRAIGLSDRIHGRLARASGDPAGQRRRAGGRFLSTGTAWMRMHPHHVA